MNRMVHPGVQSLTPEHAGTVFRVKTLTNGLPFFWESKTNSIKAFRLEAIPLSLEGLLGWRPSLDVARLC